MQDIVCIIPDGYTQESFGEQEGVTVDSYVAQVITFLAADVLVATGKVERHDLAYIRWFELCKVPAGSREYHGCVC